MSRLRHAVAMAIGITFALTGCRSDSGENSSAGATAAVATETDSTDDSLDDLAAVVALDRLDVRAPAAPVAPGTSQFAADKKAALPGCSNYGAAVSSWFDGFQREFTQLRQSFTPNRAGAAAMRGFARFLANQSDSLQRIAVSDEGLGRAHRAFVAAVLDLGDAMNDLAGNLEAGDEPRTRAASRRVENAVGNFKTAVGALVALCG